MFNNLVEDQDGKKAPSSNRQYSVEEIEAYHHELERLVKGVKGAASHYESLGVDELATTGEVKLAYTRMAALLHPSFYNLHLPQPEELLPRIDLAFEKISSAYSVLVNFSRRAEYDEELFRGHRQAATVEGLQQKSSSEDAVAPERRREQRFQLSLPVRVSGYTRQNDEWFELTETVDVSKSGALLKLVMPVRAGMILKVQMPMPQAIHNPIFAEANYDVYAIVRRVRTGDDETCIVGLEFLSDGPPQAYFLEPWAVFGDRAETIGDRAAASLVEGAESVTVEYFDAALNVISQEEASIEDLSKTGVRVCVRAIPGHFSLVRVSTNTGLLANFASVAGRYVGDDGVERLCLRFLEV